MAMRTSEQTAPTNEQVRGPAPGGLTSDNAGAENPTAQNEPATEPVSSEQASTQQQELDSTTAPHARPSLPGPNLLFPHLAWAQPGASLASTSSIPATRRPRRQYIPYVQPADMPDGVPTGIGTGLEDTDDLGVSSAFGLEGMPGILLYAPERPLLSPAAGTAGSMDAIPDRMVLCVEEDAFERAWVAPQGYWRSAF